MKRNDRGWAAGFFDGEGSTTIVPARSPYRGYLNMVLSQTEVRILRRFRRAVGCGTIIGPYRTKGSPIWMWHATNKEDVAQAISRIWPHLGTTKRRQFLAAKAKLS